MITNPNQVVAINFENESVYLQLQDGRIIGNPLYWHRWLANASSAERSNVELYEMSVYFLDLDDGLDVVEMMKGVPPRLTLQTT